MNTNQIAEINAAAKNNLFYNYNGLRYLIRSCEEDCLQLVRKGTSGDATHITILIHQVELDKFSVLKSAFGNLASTYTPSEVKKNARDPMYINPSLGVSADEIRAMQASSVMGTAKAKILRLEIEEITSFITSRIFRTVDETHVSVFVYKPSEQSVEAIAQFFNMKGFWVETENGEDGNVRFTFYW